MSGWGRGVTLGVCLAVAHTSAAWADPLPLFYQGIRPLGMGGAFTAVADDENAMMYNPAGLNKIKGFGRFDLLNPLAAISTNTIEFAQDLQDVADAQDETQQAILAADLLDKWLGERFHARAAVFPNLTVHNFGVGVLGQGQFDGAVHNAAGSNALDIRGGYDIAGVVSGAMGFSPFGSTLRVGVTGKYVQRSLLDQSYTANDLVQQDGIDLDRDLLDGSGFGFDAGVILGFPLPLSPSVGVAVQNIGDVDLGDAGILPQQINMGVALEPSLGFGRLTLAADMLDVTKELGADNDMGKRLHAGAEFAFPAVLSLRVGMNQGYLAAGATMDLRILKIAYAYSIEEVGAFAGQDPDRRHVAQLSLGF
ncbi:MAG: hypothetical protein ACOYXR_14680 [Nitrospirota bacterium]